MIAPFVHFFFRQITPVRSSINPAQFGDHYSKALEARDTLARSDTRHFVVTSFCSSQYVITLSLVVVAFVKHREISYYHPRIIHSMASLNDGSACICAYNSTAIGMFREQFRNKLLALTNIEYYKNAESEDESENESEDVSERTSSRSQMPPFRRKLSIKDLRSFFEHLTLYLSVLSYVLYSNWVAIRTRGQANYRDCFPRDIAYFVISIGICWNATVVSGLLPVSRVVRSQLQDHPVVLRLRSLRWLWTTLLSITSLVFQSIQLYAIQSAFQNQSGSTNSETQYGFGQLLVFFMVFQLVLELLIALHSQWTTSPISMNINNILNSGLFKDL
jgi:hypothetical protein